jgi:hypothetical protein
MQTTQLLALAAGLASVVSAHMEMTFPPPFKSKANPHAGQDVDYGMTSPLSADGSNVPCKGYHSLVGTEAGKPTADFAPGQSYDIKITGGANHNGGSCQASLSYDKGKTWTVIHSYIGNCPVSGESSYPFTVPSDAPGGEAIFAWTWFNKVGNREMYMNCAAVNIGGGSAAGSARRQASSAFSSRPAMFVANVNNGCKVLETTDVDFPNPGPDVSVDPAAVKKAPEGDCGSGGGSGAPGAPEPAPSSAAPGAPQQPTQQPPQPPAPSSAAPGVPQQPTQQPPQPSAPSSAAPGAPQQPTQQPPKPPAPSSAAPQPPAVPTSVPGNVFITVPPSVSTPVAAPAPSASPSTLLTLTKSGAPSVPTTPKPTPVPGNGGAGAIAAGTPCDKEGLWNCVGGSQFQRCASGQWSVLQAMASGLTCVPGQADSLSFKKRAPRGGFWWA